MAVDYVVQEREEYLYIKDSRPVTEQTVGQFCTEIPKRACESGVYKILLDQRGVPSSVGTMERYRYAVEVAKHFRGLKLAVIQDSPLRDARRFGEVVITNRGGDVHVCSTPEQAYAWLEVEENSPAAGDDR